MPTRDDAITGLPKGHVPRLRPPADNSALFGSHTREAKSLTRQAKDAEWSGDIAKADRLFAAAAHHRNEAAVNGDAMPLF